MLQTIRENLKYYREECDFSQETLSRECNYDKTYVGKIERGDTNPSIEAILRMANVLEVAPIDLLREDVSSEPDRFTEQMDEKSGQVGTLFTEVFEHTPSISFLTNTGGEILQLNEAAEKFLKAESNEVIGKTIDELNYWGQTGIDPTVISDLREMGAMGKKATRRLTFRFKGKDRDLQVQVSFAGGSDQSVRFVIFQLFFVEETMNRTLIGDHFDLLQG